MGAEDFTVCAIAGCDRVAHRWVDEQHVCQMHARRFARNGHFDATRAWGAPNPEKRVCAVDDCDALEDGRSGLCKLHDTRRRRHGDPMAVVAHADRALPRREKHS